MEEFDQILNQFELDVHSAAQRAIEKIRALRTHHSRVELSGDQSSFGPDLQDLLKPGQAQHLFGLSRSQLYRKGKEHPYDKPGGFSYRAPNGDYFYSQSRLESFLKRNPPRKRRRKAGARPAK